MARKKIRQFIEDEVGSDVYLLGHDLTGTRKYAFDKLSTLNSSTIVVRRESDLPTPIGGVITLSGDYFIAESFSTSNTIKFTSSSNIIGAHIGITITFNGSSTCFVFELSNFDFVFLNKITIANNGTGDLLDVSDPLLTTEPSNASVGFIYVAFLPAGNLGSLSNLSVFFNLNNILNISGSLLCDNSSSIFFQVATLSGDDSGVTFLDFDDVDLCIISGVRFLTSSSDFAFHISDSGSHAISSSVLSRNNSLFASGSKNETDKNISVSSVSGSPDSSNSAFITINGNATATVISTTDTPVLVAGTWTERVASRYTTTSSGRLTYIGINSINQSILVSLSAEVAGGGTPTATAYIYKNGSDIGYGHKPASGSAQFTLTLSVVDSVSTNDYYEVYIENNTNTNNITVSDISFKISD